MGKQSKKGQERWVEVSKQELSVVFSYQCGKKSVMLINRCGQNISLL